MVDIVDWEDAADMALDVTASYVLLNDLLTTTAGYATYAGPAANGGLGWIPVGMSTGKFTGELDGGGFTADGFTIDTTDSNAGFFGFTDSASVYNISFSNVSISANAASGVLCGSDVGSSTFTGVDIISGSISVVTGGAAGLISSTAGAIINCNTNVTVNSLGADGAGGLVNLLSTGGSVFQCSSAGNVSCDAGRYAGGLIAITISATVSSSYATGDVYADTFYSGGLIGDSRTGTCSTIDCYASGTVTCGANDYLGGLIGKFDGSATNCYAVGLVVGSGSNTGGLFGDDDGGVATNCFWDVETTGQPTSPAGGTGKTTVEMQTESTFTNAGWNFVPEIGIWSMEEYPQLQWAVTTALVPNVIGLTQTQAESDIIDAGLILGSVGKRYDQTIAPRLVSSQEPDAGTSLPFGEPVNINLSIGPKPSNSSINFDKYVEIDSSVILQ